MFSLTREQDELARLSEGAFLLVAPPGSGKTEVIAQRIVRLVQSSQNANYKVLALSFTKNAAATMRARVSERLGEHTWRVVCTTYHAFCLDILRHYGHLVGLPTEPTIYDSVEDRLQALAQGLVAEGLASDSDSIDRTAATELLDTIGRLERDLVPPEASPVTLIRGLGVTLRDAYRAYQLALKLNGALDFDSVLSRTHELLSTRTDVARQYRSTYRFILIDEAQDTSTAQYELLKALCGSEHRNVFMVADPAQSIYAFRGASSRFVELFAQEFHATRYELGVTFRCSAEILKAAHHLLPNHKRTAPDLARHASIAKGSIVYNAFDSELAEATGVHEWLIRLAQHGLSKSELGPDESTVVQREDVAVLARSRNHLRELLQVLDLNGTPYHFSAGEAGVFDSDEFRILLYGLKVVASPGDVAIMRSFVACVRAASLWPSLAQDEPEYANAEQLLRAASDALSSTQLASPLSTLVAACERTLLLTTAAERLMEWDPSQSASDPEAADLLSGDRTLLRDRWISYRNGIDVADRTWQGLILEIVNTPKPESAGFRVLTVHAAKGLEFRAVAVIGLNEGSFPDFRNVDPDSIESERRLMYVAVTRASRALWLSRPRQRRTRFGHRGQEQSRFLAEIGFGAE